MDCVDIKLKCTLSYPIIKSQHPNAAPRQRGAPCDIQQTVCGCQARKHFKSVAAFAQNVVDTVYMGLSDMTPQLSQIRDSNLTRLH